MIYNDMLEIVITNKNDDKYRLPHYMSVENNKVTNKKDMMVIRIFNWLPDDQTFKVGFEVF